MHLSGSYLTMHICSTGYQGFIIKVCRLTNQVWKAHMNWIWQLGSDSKLFRVHSHKPDTFKSKQTLKELLKDCHIEKCKV